MIERNRGLPTQISFVKIGLAALSVAALFPVPLSGQDADARAVYSEAAPSVLVVIAYDEHRQPKALGSAFAIDEGGVFVTNLHLIEDATSVKVRRPDQEKAVAIDGIYSVSQEHDLALLGAPFDLPPLPLTATRPNVGQNVIAIGNPRGLESTVSRGIVSGIRQIDDNFELYQISSPISPGSSGGPVLNANGQVLGVATASLQDGQNLNFAVPASLVEELNEGRGQLTDLATVSAGGTQPDPAWTSSDEDGAVRAVDLRLRGVLADPGEGRQLGGSIYNGTQYPIRNVRLRLICYREGVDVPVDYDDVTLFGEEAFGGNPIPPGLAQPISFLECTDRATDVELRILDYELVR